MDGNNNAVYPNCAESGSDKASLGNNVAPDTCRRVAADKDWGVRIGGSPSSALPESPLPAAEKGRSHAWACLASQAAVSLVELRPLHFLPTHTTMSLQPRFHPHILLSSTTTPLQA